MAFSASVAYTNTQYAAAFAKVLNRKASRTFGKLSPFFANVFSELPENLAHTPFSYDGQLIRSSEGGRVKIHWQGGAVNVDTVADPSAAATGTYGTKAVIASEADLTRYNVMHQMDVMDFKFIKGKEASLDGYMEREAERVLRSFLETVSTAFWATGDQTKTTLGSFRRAIDIDDTVGTYLGIERLDAGNIGLRGHKMTAAAFTLARLDEGIDRVTEVGGTADLVLASRVNYAIARTALSAMDSVNDPALRARYGAKYVDYRGTAVCMDGYAPATVVAVMSTNTWAVSFDADGFMCSEGSLIRDVTKKQMMVMPVDLNVAVVCENPRLNCHILVS